jgi:rhodanese-related sulfurtransferase
MNRNRNLGLGAAAILIAGAAGAAFAHPHPDGDGDGKKVERVIIIRDGAGGEHHAAGEGERVRRFEIIRDGKGEHHAGLDGDHIRRFEIRDGALVDCGGGEKIVDESAGDGDRKTKVIICSKGAPSAAAARHLEEALARINANDELSDEQKAKIETALRAAIDRARSAR